MATMSTPALHVTPDNTAVNAEIFIAAPRERIFQALTDPKQAAQWWGHGDKYRFSQFEMDVRVGGRWSCSGTSTSMGTNIAVHGEFLEIDPPRRLCYTWMSSWMPTVTEVLWELDQQNGGTLLKLTHTGFAGNADQTKAHTVGWSLVLGWLQAFAEKGETVDQRN
jgi:uncharacterized protein YndB with AHSA1/START domain